jgi:putative glycosyltransferase (TIGR04348 family)
MLIQLLTPAAFGSRHGNRVTALRWAKRLRELGHRVRLGGEPGDCDVLVAVHAVRSAAAVAAARAARPRLPIVVCLAGTDLYGALEPSLATLALANRVVALHPHAEQALPEPLRARTRVILQSARVPPDVAPAEGFQICVVAHLRAVKDPLRVARAARLLPAASRARVVHLGAALAPEYAAAARAEEAENPRFRWLGDRPRLEALCTLAASRLFVLPSEAEGGANALSEAVAAGLPIVCSAIPGSLGLLGADHPGAYPAGDTAALAALLERAETDDRFLHELSERTRALGPLVRPERERAEWRALLAEVTHG